MHYIKRMVELSRKWLEDIVRMEIYVSRQPFLRWELGRGDVEAFYAACSLILGGQRDWKNTVGV